LVAVPQALSFAEVPSSALDALEIAIRSRRNLELLGDLVVDDESVICREKLLDGCPWVVPTTPWTIGKKLIGHFLDARVEHHHIAPCSHQLRIEP
jgi:hypothetical protein